MRTILIAQRDVAFAEQLAIELRAAGYCALACAGPLPPAERCIRCDKGYCPQTEGADLMIYDPQLTAVEAGGQRHSLGVNSSLAHPEVPMLLARSKAGVPVAGALRAIVAQVPCVHVAAHEPAAHLRQVHDLLAAAAAPAR
ncbi:MAG: hypothetical protein M3069_31425 [Chloroflexota bacterium]|nr:hypothetical protein [Chloroflexota bacterium]